MLSEFTKLKKDYLNYKYKNLNPVQRDVCFEVNGPVLILAGAGSGKTTTVTNRISYMIKYGDSYNSDFLPQQLTKEQLSKMQEKGVENIDFFDEQYFVNNPVSPYNILAITFTNKAAAEMRERVEKLVGRTANAMWLLTFHSACVRILRTDIERLGFDKSFAIYDAGDSKTLIKECMNDLHIDEKVVSHKFFAAMISSFKDKFILPDQVDNFIDNSPNAQYLKRVYRLYQQKLKKYNALDFDDLLLQTVLLFKKNPDVLKKWQDRFKYIIVDEYQDTSKIQYMFISALSREHKNICVVGDDDQSIYRFRGADIENILSFEKQFDNCKVIKLEQNYRSTKTILEAANSVIANNGRRKSKRLWTDNEPGEKISLLLPYNEKEEAETVGKQIEKYVDNGGKYSDVAILYRTNAQSRALEENFLKNGIPHRVIGGTRFFDRKEIKDIIAYMRVAYNIGDDMSLKRIINVPKRGLGNTAIAKLESIAAMENRSIFQVLEQVEMYPELSRYQKELRNFVKLIYDFQVDLDDLEKFMTSVIYGSGYIDMLNAEDSIEAKTRIDNIKELMSMAKEFVELENDDDDEFEAEFKPDGSVGSFLENMALLSDIDNYDKDEDATVLMSMHGAKGLEFPVVFIVGVEEGLFPSAKSAQSSEELEEERRLCYVAITRAKRKLYITVTSQRMLFGQTSISRPSRFLAELPNELIAKQQFEQEFKKPVYDTYIPKYISPKKASANVLNTIKEAKREAPPSLEFDFKENDRVKHAKFGVGTILSAQKLGSDMKLTIMFDSGERKVLMATFAKLQYENQ